MSSSSSLEYSSESSIEYTSSSSSEIYSSSSYSSSSSSEEYSSSSSSSLWDKHSDYPITFSLEEIVSKPVWKLAYSGEYIFAGTGDQGYILRSSNGFHWENYYKTNDFHVTALFVYNNYLYSGTSSSGYIYITDLLTNETVLSQKLGGEVTSFVSLNEEIYVSTSSPAAVYKLNTTTKKWDVFYQPYGSKIFKLYVDNGELSMLVK